MGQGSRQGVLGRQMQLSCEGQVWSKGLWQERLSSVLEALASPHDYLLILFMNYLKKKNQIHYICSDVVAEGTVLLLIRVLLYLGGHPSGSSASLGLLPRAASFLAPVSVLYL